MQIEVLREFSSIAKHLSFAKASRELFVSPSSLSKHMNALESELGVALLTRSKHGVELTTAGKAFAKQIKTVLASYEEAVTDARAAAKTNQSIVISYLMGLCRGFLPEVAKTFGAANLQTAVSYKGMIMSELLDEIAEGRSDAYIIPEIVELPKSFNQTLLHTYSYGAIMRKDHPLAQKEELLLDDLKGQTVKIMNDRRLGAYQGNLLSFIAPIRDSVTVESDIEEVDNWLFALLGNDNIGLELEANKSYLGRDLAFIPFSSSCENVPRMAIYYAFDRGKRNAAIESFEKTLRAFKGY